MNEINFMDLERQYIKHKDEFMSAIEKVCDETAFSGGKYVELFENEFAQYLGVKKCEGVNSGTSALFLAVTALGIGEGDEVIVPTNTFIASAWGVVHAGATPVFVDCTRDTWEINASEIESRITNRTKAIIGVHLYGHPFDFDAIKDIALKYNLKIIEDCAQSHGAKYKGMLTGSMGDVACFSFYPGKNLGAFGEAGAVVSNDENIIEKIRLLKNHGAKIRYSHEIIGYNMRMDGIQGAILSVKLKYLNEWNEKRRLIAKRYFEEINNPRITMQKIDSNVEPVHHLFEIQTQNAEEFINYMKRHGINCGRHYPIPCHLQKAFEYLNYKVGDFPNAETLAKNCVSLPLFPELEKEEVEYVVELCNQYRG